MNIYCNKNLLEHPKLISSVKKMKKKELFAISLLSILVFVSFANVAVAAPPSYVGVKTGETYIWRASLNMVNLNTTANLLFGADNWTLMYESFILYFETNTGMEFDFLKGAGMKAVLTNVTDEMPHPWITGFDVGGLYFDQYVSYAENNWTLVTNSSMFTEPMLYLFNPSDLNSSTITMAAPNLFTSKGYNYAMFVTFLQTMIASDPYMNGNITVAVEGNGFTMTLKAAYLEYMFESLGAPYEMGTLKDAKMTFRWNSNGVFDKGSLKYDGLELATAYLETDEVPFIPGYELVTILGVSLVTFIALVYTIKKKKI